MTHTYRDKESTRLDELRRYQVLDSAPEPAFERVVRLAQQFFEVPTVLISLVDEDRQWFKARCGFDLCETNLESSFCIHAIHQDKVMVVPDATQDVRFFANPLVTGKPFIRFYAGAPLQTARGHKLGTLCLIDSVPHHKFSAVARAALSDFAELVIDEFELRLIAREVERQQRRIQIVFESITDAFFTVDRQWHLSYPGPFSRRGSICLV
jgi:GAF domain-containing protein